MSIFYSVELDRFQKLINECKVLTNLVYFKEYKVLEYYIRLQTEETYDVRHSSKIFPKVRKMLYLFGGDID